MRHITVVLLVLLFTACGPSGSGNVVGQTRNVGPFDRIDVSSALDLVLVVAPGAAQSVTVGYDDDLQDRIVVRVEGTTLVLEIDGTVNLIGEGRAIEVVAPDLVALTASGAADVEASGALDALRLTSSGASDVDLSNLGVGDLEVAISGASDVTVFATASVTGSVRPRSKPTTGLKNSGFRPAMAFA